MKIPARWALLLSVLVLAEVAVRGPFRALRTSGDLAVGYAAARVWLDGGDPYDMRQVGLAYMSMGGTVDQLPTHEYMPFIYPAPTLALTAPLALIHWRWAVELYTVAVFALVVLALFLLARRAGLGDAETAFAVIGALALAPLQTGLGNGQGGILCVALVVIGWTIGEDRPVLGGALACMGAIMKPHLALPFLLLFALRPRLKFAASGVAVAAVLTAIGAWRLERGGHHWVRDWLAAVAEAARPDGANFPGPDNARSISMINADMLLMRFPLGEWSRRALKLLLLAPAAVLAAWSAWSARDRKTELTALSLLCVAALLSMYHRTYDAFLLAVPLAALTARADELRPAERWAAGLCFAAFLWPGAPVLGAATEAGWVPTGLAASGVWRMLLVPHQIWALIALEAVLASVLLRPCAAPAGTVLSSPT